VDDRPENFFFKWLDNVFDDRINYVVVNEVDDGVYDIDNGIDDALKNLSYTPKKRTHDRSPFKTPILIGELLTATNN